jgi:N-glycosylase/DNA lyase
MKHDTEFNENIVLLRNPEHFDPEMFLFCGQAFRWQKDGGRYIGVAHGRVVCLEPAGEAYCLYPATEQEYRDIWEDYFDLLRDYGAIKQACAGDAVLAKGMEYACGMRVLNQEPFETLISFIISANNNIKRITGIIDKLSMRYGKKLHFEGREYQAFPSARALAAASVEGLLSCGAGYRAAYIKAAAQSVCDGFDLEALKSLPYEEAKKRLTGIMGVGKKVADCILLYSLHFAQAFPMDVWMKRAVFNVYGYEGGNDKEIGEYIAAKFGKDAGIKQQYLFHYVRKNKLGI